MNNIRSRNFGDEFEFSASRSGGAGGQNVNKVNTKVELRFNVVKSKIFSEREKQIVLRKLSNRIYGEGDLVIVSQDERTQFRNKESSIEKFYQLIEVALRPVKKRKPTKPSKASKERRIQTKRNISAKKANRRVTDE